jgi:hypothetical protein
MIDLVAEEERIAHLTGLGFEALLRALDDETPADLCARYALVTDRYLSLAGKARRTPEERVELDRLDSSLRMLLDEGGLMVQAGRLLRVREAPRAAFATLAGPRLEAGALARIGALLADAARVCREGLRGPLPVPSEDLAEALGRTAEAIEELTGLVAGRATSRTARRGLARLTARLAAAGAGPAAWAAAAELGEARPGRARTGLAACWTAVGLVTCGHALERLERAIEELAGLVREDMGA